MRRGVFGRHCWLAPREPFGKVYVADRCNRRVQRFTALGGFLATFGVP